MVVDLYDRPAVTTVLDGADGAIHTASPGDATSANLDAAVVDAVTGAFGGSGRPYLHVSGESIYGPNTAITEESPLNAPPLVAWKPRSKAECLMRKGCGAWSSSPASPMVMAVAGCPDCSSAHPVTRTAIWLCSAPAAALVHVHAADLADFFRRALEGVGPGPLPRRQWANPTVAELTEAAAVAVGAPGAVPGSDEEARARLGDYFAEVLLLDQGTDAARARDELDWDPSHPSLTEEFRQGSYRG